jgi:D-alanyl-D-alanine carboxypeptidase
MRNSGITFKQPPRQVEPTAYQQRGQQVAAVESDSLIRIVQYLNAFSVNSMAEMLALHVGGPAGVERFLIDEIGMPRQSVFISHASGLDINRLTPRHTVRLLRAMMGWLDRHQLPPSSVMPVAGRDAGTLRARFAENEFVGSVVAKTGTLYSTDAGVAALAGILYTRDHGPLLFAVYDMAEGRRVDQLRRIQDQFLKDLMTEFGGPDTLFGRAEPQAALQIESRVKLPSGEVVI